MMMTFIEITVAVNTDVWKSTDFLFVGLFLLTLVFFTWQPNEVEQVFHKFDVLHST